MGVCAHYVDPYVHVGQFIAVMAQDSDSVCGGYRIIWVMHQGQTCVIYEAAWEGREVHYAFPGQKFVFKWFLPWVGLELASREMELLSQFQSYEEFVPLLDVSPFADSVGFFMPMADPGDLRAFLFGSETQLPHILDEVSACELAQDLAIAIRKMHADGVVHGDVKLENCLLSNPPALPGQTERPRVQLCDFGWARNCGPDDRLAGPVGTPFSQPPELLDEGWFGQKIDIFCFGTVVFVALARTWAFPLECEEAYADAVRGGRFDVAALRRVGVSESAIDLLSHCFDPVESRRFSADQLCEHEWLQGLSDPTTVD